LLTSKCPADMDSEIINVSYIEEVCDNSSELIADMVEIFRDQVCEFGTSMKNMLKDEQYYELGLMAHKAKSSVAIMGMEQLARSLKELEANAKAGEKTDSYRKHVDDFIDQTGKAVKELEAYLKTL